MINSPDREDLRKEHRFTLEALAKDKNVNIYDCQQLQSYAKVLYEQGKYKEAENLLFSLKEILVNESTNQPELVFQVFWGLLACEILNEKHRDKVENISLKKMKDLIERKFDAQGINPLTSSQEHTEIVTWLLHWLLIYSFTSEDLTSTGLFATILTDHKAYGTHFLNIVQMRSESLSRYMTTSFLLCRGQPNENYQIDKNSIEKHALPIALEAIKAGQSDPFSLFLKAVYDDYDLTAAQDLVE